MNGFALFHSADVPRLIFGLAVLILCALVAAYFLFGGGE